MRIVVSCVAAVLLKDVDPDQSGKISFEEFVRLLNKTRGNKSVSYRTNSEAIYAVHSRE